MGCSGKSFSTGVWGSVLLFRIIMVPFWQLVLLLGEVVVVEAQAILIGLVFIVDKGYDHTIVESISLSAV